MRIHSGRTSGNYLTNLSSAKITLNPSSYVYDGNPKTPAVMVELNGVVLRPNQDYTVEYSDNMSAGTASVRINGMGPFEGSAQKEYSISLPEEPSTSLTRATVTLPYKETTYTGSALTPTPTVVLNGTTLTAGTHYSVTYSSNTDRGTATVMITGISPYTGSTTATFKILSPDLASATMELNAYVFNYTGALVRPVPTVRISVGGTSVLLVKDTDYTVSYEYTGARGTAYAVVTGIGGYTGSTKKSFQIGKDFSSAEIDIGATEYPYTGGEVRPWATVTMAGQTLTDGVDFDLTYEDNVEVGVGRVIATGKGDYAGSVTKLMSVSNAENNAWKNLTLNNGMVRQTGFCNIPLSAIDPNWARRSSGSTSDWSDSKIMMMQPLPDGSVAVFAKLGRTNSWDYFDNPLFFRIRFSDGHPYDFLGGDSSNDYAPQYMLRKQNGDLDIETMAIGRDIMLGDDPRGDTRMPQYCDYGRKLLLRGVYNNGKRGTIDLDGYSSSSGLIRLSQSISKKSIAIADLATPYSVNTKGCERLAYTSDLGGSSAVMYWRTFFSSDGKKFFCMDLGLDGGSWAAQVSLIRVFTLKTPWVLDGQDSVESETVMDIGALNHFYGYVIYQTPRFSPDGRHALVMPSNGGKRVLYKHDFSSPWDLGNSSIASQTTAHLVEEDGSTTVTAWDNGWFVSPLHHRLIVAGLTRFDSTGPGFGFRTFTI